MSGAHQQPRSTGWGLPRGGAAHAPGASWEGEGQQSRPEPPPRGRTWRALLVIGLGVLLAAGALLIAGRDSDETAAVAEPERIAEETTEVEPGACLATLPAKDSSDPLDLVACEEQHLGEVVGTFDLDEGAYPGEVAVLTQAQDGCAEEFTSYVGTPPGSSTLNLLPVVPRENDWIVDGDRTVVCLAEGPALVGSVQGTAR